jgi:galactonate dehydratase
MRITDIRVYPVGVDFRTWLLVKVETDEGLYGWGEATLEWKSRSVTAAVDELRTLCIGEDPTAIRALVRKLLKRHFWEPGAIGMTAISGIEVACWDIFGKATGRPVVDLLGGAVRERVPLYTHLGLGRSDDVYGASLSEAALAGVEEIASRGYRALKLVNVPFHDQYIFGEERHRFLALLDRILVACAGRVEVALDVHGRCGSVASADALLTALASRDLLFVEELLKPGPASVLAALARKHSVRLATGERLVAVADFADLVRADAVAILQPDIAHFGGLARTAAVASLAEAFQLSVAPHNPLGLVASTAALHFALATPNHLIQEEMSAHFAAAADFISTPICFDNGTWTLAPCTGLGIEVDEAFVSRLGPGPETLLTEAAVDPFGAVVDW